MPCAVHLTPRYPLRPETATLHGWPPPKRIPSGWLRLPSPSAMTESLNRAAPNHDRPPLGHPKHASVLTQLLWMSRAIGGGHTGPVFVRSPLKDAPAIKNSPRWRRRRQRPERPPLGRDRPLFTRAQRLFSCPLTSVIFAFFARDSPTQREAARSKREAPRQTEARAGAQSAIDGPRTGGHPERHLQWMERSGEERKCQISITGFRTVNICHFPPNQTQGLLSIQQLGRDLLIIEPIILP